MSLYRYDRIGEEIKKVLSEAVRELKDPRVSDMTTIMRVEVSSDLCLAKVRVSVYDEDDDARTGTIEALNHAAGFLSREIGRRMDIRKTPALKFMLDNSIEYSVHISGVLNSLNIGGDEESEGNDAGKPE